MDKILFLAAALALAGCAARPPDSAAMGAGPACDLGIQTRTEQRCAVSHVSPAVEETQISSGMRTLQPQAAPTAPRP